MKTTGHRAGGLVRAGAVLAGVVALAAVAVGPAQATDDLDGYQGDEKNVNVETDRSYDEATNQTTFTFRLTADENVSHVLLMDCPGIDIVSATGPEGAKKESDTPKNDASIDHDHVGIKFEPGVPGAYTITFAGNITGAEFVVKDSTGHKHFTAGSQPCQTVSPSQPGAGTSDGDTADGGTAGGGTTDGTAAPSGQTGQTGPDAQVAGQTETRPTPTGPSTEVLGAQQTAPEAQANLPRTGPVLPLLAPIGTVC